MTEPKRNTWHQFHDGTWSCERTGEIRMSLPSQEPLMRTADDCLKTAASLVSGDRATQHGDKAHNLENIAALWNAFMFIFNSEGNSLLKSSDVATMMELLKISRRYTGTFNPDDYIDAAGYAAIAMELKNANRHSGQV